MIAAVLFWIIIYLFIHSYIIYPKIVTFIARKKLPNSEVFITENELPHVAILLSVYNEQEHIFNRVTNIFETNYPLEKLEVWVGSDNSSDTTNEKLKKLEKEFPGLHVIYFQERQGKPSVLNKLHSRTNADILILTDAKVLFRIDTIFELVKHFKNNSIGITGANLINTKISNDGISQPENTYLSGEMALKNAEGLIWGKTVGVYGACYAMRKELFENFPDGFAVDDFYSNLVAFAKNKKVIVEEKAHVYENVTNRLPIEFNRKMRISTGNFQNFGRFVKLFFTFWQPGFSLVSHKLIRWLGPFLLISLLICNLIVFQHHWIYRYAFAFQLFTYCIPIIDFFLHIIRADILILRFVTHFHLMNLALMVGFIKYIKRKKSNVWEPTKR